MEVAGDRLAPISLWRNDRQDASDQQVRPHRVAVISLICQQYLGLGDGQCHQVIDRPVIGCLAAGQDEAERASLIVAAGMDLARKAAT